MGYTKRAASNGAKLLLKVVYTKDTTNASTEHTIIITTNGKSAKSRLRFKLLVFVWILMVIFALSTLICRGVILSCVGESSGTRAIRTHWPSACRPVTKKPTRSGTANRTRNILKLMLYCISFQRKDYVHFELHSRCFCVCVSNGTNVLFGGAMATDFSNTYICWSPPICVCILLIPNCIWEWRTSPQLLNTT